LQAEKPQRYLMFKYWGYGLHILSDIEFPELYPIDFETADVTIEEGNVPTEISGDNVLKKVFSSISRDEYLWNIRTVAKYYAGFGSTVKYEPVAGIDMHSVRLFLLGTAMAAILYQRGDIPLHASAIVHNGKLTLFAGDSGAGKSTLIARLATAGYNVFTDDVCVLHHLAAGTNEIHGTASYPMMKLWDDAISQIDNEKFTRDFKVRPQLPKFGQFFYESFNVEVLPVEKIYILSPKDFVQDIAIQKLSPVNAFRLLEKQAYKYQLIVNTELRAVHFSLLSRLTAGVPVYEITRPTSRTDVHKLFEVLEKEL
jgi:hypothetical protein